jgi:predicted TIM-barrel enzyme
MSSPIAKLQFVLGAEKPLIAMIHVQALPGTPGYAGSMQYIIDAALRGSATQAGGCGCDPAGEYA